MELDKSLTLDAFMTQLGTYDGGEAGKMLMKAESAAKRIKAEYGLSVDDALFLLKDSKQEVIEKGAADAVGQARTIKSYISTLAPDRDSEAVLPEGMDRQDYSGIVLYSHQYGEMGMGECLWIVPNEAQAIERSYALLAKTRYASKAANPKAEEVYQWQIEELPMGKSIGFIPIDWKTPDDKDWPEIHDSWSKRAISFLKEKGRENYEEAVETIRRIFTKWALLEYSDVMVPANAHCVNMALAKGLLMESEVDRYIIKTEDDGEAATDDIDAEFQSYLRGRDDADLLRKLSGGDALVDDLEDETRVKAGRMISSTNMAKLRMAWEAIGAVITAAEPPEVEEDSAELPETKDIDFEITPEIAELLLALDEIEEDDPEPAELTANEKLSKALGRVG